MILLSPGKEVTSSLTRYLVTPRERAKTARRYKVDTWRKTWTMENPPRSLGIPDAHLFSPQPRGNASPGTIRGSRNVAADLSSFPSHPARPVFSTFPLASFFSVASLFRAVAGNRRSRRARDGSYRYDAIADTRRGRLLRPPSPPRRPAPRYIDLFSSFAYELFRFGSPGVYSRMKICSAAKYFSDVPRLGPRVDPRFGPPLPLLLRPSPPSRIT